MYSKAGPVMVVLPGPCATGTVMVVLNPALLVPAEKSQPLHTMVYPRGIRKAFASATGSVTEPGSLPPALNRPSDAQVFRPRLGGSYITLCAPFPRSTGLRM